MSQYSDDCQSAGEQFLSFTIRFFNLIKASYQQHNQIKANTVAFHAMVRLNQPDTQAPTMSELAKELDIPKQQLTKLVNGLESKGLVKRQHDSVNRRQVHLYINPLWICHYAPAETGYAGLHCNRAYLVFQGGAI